MHFAQTESTESCRARRKSVASGQVLQCSRAAVPAGSAQNPFLFLWTFCSVLTGPMFAECGRKAIRSSALTSLSHTLSHSPLSLGLSPPLSLRCSWNKSYVANHVAAASLKSQVSKLIVEINMRLWQWCHRNLSLTGYRGEEKGLLGRVVRLFIDWKVIWCIGALFKLWWLIDFSQCVKQIYIKLISV